VALVIGNSAYHNAATLPNTINDATAIATMFKNAGFDDVDMRQDLGVLEFKRALREFMNTSRNVDIAVIYFAGHGIESAGTNYLIPIDGKLASDYDAEDEAVSLDRVILALQPAQRLRLIILDACRDNPFVNRMQRAVAIRGVPNGLAKIEPATPDTLIAYAAKAGSVSYDGTGAHSPFTTALVKYLAEPGLDIRIALGRVRDEVIKSTGKRQEPFVYGSLGGTTVSLVPQPAAPEVEAAPPPASETRRAYELTDQLGTREAWESFLKEHRTGFYADLARMQLAKLTGHLAPKPSPDEERSEKQELPAKGGEESCKREEERLAKLRADPKLDDVIRFARDLSCEDLRPQVLRLLESVSFAPPAAAQPVPVPIKQYEEQRAHAPDAKPVGRSEPQDQACQRDAERLKHLRADPKREDVERFSRELTCEAVRPQVARLLESLGN
jgi:hypothetical protein